MLLADGTILKTDSAFTYFFQFEGITTLIRFVVMSVATESILLGCSFLKAFQATLNQSDQSASCRPSGPNDPNTSEPTVETVRTSKRKSNSILTEELKFTTNTKKITTEHMWRERPSDTTGTMLSRSWPRHGEHDIGAEFDQSEQAPLILAMVALTLCAAVSADTLGCLKPTTIIDPTFGPMTGSFDATARLCRRHITELPTRSECDERTAGYAQVIHDCPSFNVVLGETAESEDQSDGDYSTYLRLLPKSSQGGIIELVGRAYAESKYVKPSKTNLMSQKRENEGEVCSAPARPTSKSKSDQQQPGIPLWSE
uniref:Uncharacterized protein n=1 Tax=Glossina austeni TaxID=7395 RepID=A0A1A9USG4_GLOAU